MSPAPRSVSKYSPRSSPPRLLPASPPRSQTPPTSLTSFTSKLVAAERRRCATLQSRIQQASTFAEQRLRQAAQRRNRAQQQQLQALHAALDSKEEAAAARRGAELAKVRARCAQHWRRQQQARLRAERQAEALTVQRAQRLLQKLALSRRRRRRASPGAAEEAARKIQRWFRRMRVRQNLATLTGAGLLVQQQAQPLDFETMAVRLQDPDVLRATQHLLAAVDREATHASTASASTPTTRPTTASSPVRCRRLLSAFMVHNHPDCVFDQLDGPLEQAAREAAAEMLSALQAWAQAESAQPICTPVEQLAFDAAWRRYAAAFLAWQRRDLSSLVNGLVAHHQQLTAMHDSIVGQDDDSQAANARWLPLIDAQQQMVEERLRAMHATRQAEACESQRCQRQQLQARRQSRMVSRARTVSGEGHAMPPPPVDNPAAAAAVCAAKAMGVNVAETATAATAEAVEAVAEEAPILPAGLTALWDASLLHEIAVDSQFQLRREHPEHVDAQRQALLDAIERELQAQPRPHTDRFAALLTEVRDGLQACTLPRQERLRQEIAGRLDVELICQQAQAGVLDSAELQKEILRQCRQLAAPARDDDLSALEANTGPLTLVRFLDAVTDILQDMRLDLANFLLSSYRPLICQHAIAMERDKLEQAVASGVLPLEKSRQWLKAAVEARQIGGGEESAGAVVAAVAPGSSPPHAPARDEAGRPSFLTLYYAAFEQLLASTTPLDERNCPETLLVG